MVYLISGYELRHYAAAVRRRLKVLSQELGWREQIARLKAVKGIGLLSCYALLVAYHSGRFVHHDAFVAYLGLDVRARKLARLAFQLLSKNLEFDPTRLGASQRT